MPVRWIIAAVLIVANFANGVVADEPAVDAEPVTVDTAPFDAAPFDAALFLKKYCIACHDGPAGEAHLDLSGFQVLDAPAVARIAADATGWNKLAQRVRDSEMPPEGNELPQLAEREQFFAWVRDTLHDAACADGISPGPAPLRRLNRNEYAATIRDLLNIHIDAGQALPADGSGGEGFDNAAETLFISPLHAEKYLDAAKVALGYAFTDPRSRERFLTAQPNDEISPEDAARRVVNDFLPRAFRRPVTPAEVEEFTLLFRAAFERDAAFEPALQLTLEAALVSPHFLFRLEEANLDAAPRLVGSYEVASRLSYFLWGTMPDRQLFEVAAAGKLNDPQVLEQQVQRMLRGEENRQNERIREFAQSFTEQWLGTRALGREFKPDPSIAKGYDSELEGGMKYEPVLFFEEIIAENRSLLNFIDSDFTYVNRRLAQHYQLKGDFNEQPKRTELPADSQRGGLLGMASVLAVSSHPYRTSPVLRGKWVLESMLGAPTPPPPPNVPQLDDKHDGANATTLRQRLEQHRQDPACASCHARIDPLGFGLENYDVLGNWRTEQEGQKIDASGILPDGTHFEGPTALKQLLLARKEQFIRNLTAKMLGYALGRGLTNEDYCTVDEIVAQLAQHDYQSHVLVLGIVRSVPFRYKTGTDALLPVQSLPVTSQEKSP